MSVLVAVATAFLPQLLSSPRDVLSTAAGDPPSAYPWRALAEDRLPTSILQDHAAATKSAPLQDFFLEIQIGGKRVEVETKTAVAPQDQRAADFLPYYQLQFTQYVNIFSPSTSPPELRRISDDFVFTATVRFTQFL